MSANKKIVQETRLFDERKRVTVPMRTKEDAPDYRYFPEPDLVELDISPEFVLQIKSKIPELPAEKVKRFTEKYGIPRSEVLILTKQREVADYFEECARYTSNYKRLSLWIINELFRLLKGSGISIKECPVKPESLSELINLTSEGSITEQIAKSVLEDMFATGKSPSQIIKEKDIKVIQEEDIHSKIVEEVISENLQIMEK